MSWGRLMPIFESLGFQPVISKNADSFSYNYLSPPSHLSFGRLMGAVRGFLRDMLYYTGAPFCCFINLYCRLGLLRTSPCDVRTGVGSGDKFCLDKAKISPSRPFSFYLNTEGLRAFPYVYAQYVSVRYK